MPSLNLKRTSKARNYAIGIGLLLVVVFLWTFSNFLTQDLFEGGYDKPFLVTYLNTTAFAFYLFPFVIRKYWASYRKQDSISTGTYQPLRQDLSSTSEFTIDDVPIETRDTPLTPRETARLAFYFMFLWFIANWTLNAALGYTSVASATILSSTSGFFTLALGRLFRVETLSGGKIGAVLTSFTGVILVSLSDSARDHPVNPASVVAMNSRPIFGDFLALLSAIFYALYVIFLKVQIQEESRIDMQLFFGFVGLFNVFCCWPLGFILHWTGLENFELPSGEKVIAAIVINMFITLSSDFLYVLSMLKTSPLVVTVGLSLTIPLAVVGDFFLGKPTKGQVLFGALLVLIAFSIIGIENSKVKNEQDREEEAGVSGQHHQARLGGDLS
ncbi:hypothetical protein SERLA73DRAFT_185071 [Serpula lacrymans var. lacrymans S7.3]|uniref:EamA domain-containing protein n=2 Tax=Serpula lacrymans var. lacrymans TaxID=341189 RepID=F8Q405_SERL3|nr:uncharacterized protein SERLADRAFT_473312 [Serpula lacrymans var. lacrymans S7.9]EGN96861.1 hypothetical protein SERLA73DRAFT_185071 [Serpula lacrymans var. lacrymans S7.3]EGO22460.1 hypothetical protein SERLADRAFT_473312 [Serpula lacrymans var. lacrymans S7.9]